jgi:hypothetical protein
MYLLELNLSAEQGYRAWPRGTDVLSLPFCSVLQRRVPRTRLEGTTSERMCYHAPHISASVPVLFPVLPVLIALFIGRKDIDIHYTHSTRWFQTLLSTHAFEQNGGGEAFQEVDLFPDHEFHQFLFFHDTAREPPAMVPLDTFLSIGSWDRDCPAAEMRRTELFDTFRSEEDPTTRLVEGRYYLGDGIRLCLLLEVEPTYHVPGAEGNDEDGDEEEEEEEEEDEEEEDVVEIEPGASKIVRSVVQIECVPSRFGFWGSLLTY